MNASPFLTFMLSMFGVMDGWTDGWIDGWMDGRDGRRDGWMDGCVVVYTYTYLENVNMQI